MTRLLRALLLAAFVLAALVGTAGQASADDKGVTWERILEPLEALLNVTWEE